MDSKFVQIPKEGRVLAIDYGESQIGLAITDSLQITAQACDTISLKSNRKAALEKLAQLCSERQVVGIVLGLPRHMNGSLGEMAQKVKKFRRALENMLRLPVLFMDERLSSVEAERQLVALGKKPSRHKKSIHQMSAAVILRNFLDSRN